MNLLARAMLLMGYSGLCGLAAAAPSQPAHSTAAVRGEGVRVLYWGARLGGPGYAAQVRGVLGLEYIAGLDVYVPWSQLESTEGAYRWDLFDVPLSAAAATGKSVGIGLLVAAQSPAWVKERAATFACTHIHPSVGLIRPPVPWDDAYRRALGRTVAALGRRYDGNPHVWYVVINGPSTLYGVETNWPMKRGSLSPEDERRLGFTLERFRDCWKEMVDLFLQHFRRSTLSLALHHHVDAVGVSPEEAGAAAREIREYALARYAEARGPQARMILQLLGLNHANPRYFAGPHDGASAPNAYVSLAWETRSRARLGYECMQV